MYEALRYVSLGCGGLVWRLTFLLVVLESLLQLSLVHLAVGALDYQARVVVLPDLQGAGRLSRLRTARVPSGSVPERAASSLLGFEKSAGCSRPAIGMRRRMGR